MAFGLTVIIMKPQIYINLKVSIILDLKTNQINLTHFRINM